MTTFKLKRLSGVGSKTKGGDRLKGDPRLLGLLSFPDGNYLVATPLGYDSIKLQFLVPSVFLGYTRVAVVRSSYGFPVNKHDGVTVFEYPNTATPLSQTFIDTNFGQGLIQGQWYYYTLFAKMPNSIPNWNQVDVDCAVVTKDHGSADRLWNKLPAFYQNDDANTLQRQLVYTQGGQLRRFIDLLGYEEDMIRTTLETLLYVNSPKDMASGLLELQGYDLSLSDEGAIGDARFRALVDSALGIRETKGTATGITQYIRAISDYDARVLARRNLMQSTVTARGTDVNSTLDPTVFSGVLAADPGWRLWYDGAAPGIDDARWILSSSVPITAPTTLGYTGKTKWMYRLRRAGISSSAPAITHIDGSTVRVQSTGFDTTWSVLSNSAHPVPIPLTGVTYTFSVLMVALNPANLGTVNLRFVWFDALGNFLSSDTHAVATPTALPGPPTVRSAVSSAAPAGAVFCNPEIYLPGLTTGVTTDLYSGAAQLELTSTATGTYIDPHTAEIQLIAQRVNLVQNPSAEVDNTLWTTLNMTSFTSTVVATATAGAKVFRITCNASTPTRMTVSSFMPINPAYVYSMRFNAMVPNATIGCNAIITWYDNAATPNVVRTDTLNFPAPLPTSVMREFIFGSVVPPAGAAQARVAIEFTSVANGNVIDVDSVLFGPGPPMWYFDGDTQDGLDTPASVTPTQFSDFQWGGTQGKSTSYYYNNFYIIQKRLASDIVNWVPYGTQVNFITLIAP